MRLALASEEKSHSPQGECGLKLQECLTLRIKSMSLPARGVWIEIQFLLNFWASIPVTPRKGSVD